jgi:hypothetical protein
MPKDNVINESILLLEMEQITEQLKSIAISVKSINSTLRIMADRMLRTGK